MLETGLLARIQKAGVQNEQFIRLKNKKFSLKSGRPQDAWTPIWLKG